MQPSEAKSPHSVNPSVKPVFKDELLQYLKHCKMALGWEGRLMLVPKHAEEKDYIVVLFGADIPLLLRFKFGLTITRQLCFQRIGTVYTMDLMHGEALHLAQMKSLKVTGFTLL